LPQRVESAKLDGIVIINERNGYYHYDELAGGTSWITNIDNKGISGIELQLTTR